MRIISGSRRGMKLSAPRGDAVRPTADALRESLFNVLGQSLEGVKFLDLFGGSGAVGLEAASRGALVVIVERDPQALRSIEHNLEHCRLQDMVTVQRGDAITFLARTNRTFDIIYVDPPFGEVHWYAGVMSKIIRKRPLSEDGLLILEHRAKERLDIPPGLQLKKTRVYGKNSLSFLSLTLTADQEALHTV